MTELDYFGPSDDIYCYPGTGVLKNRFGIRDRKALEEKERTITMIRLVELDKNPVKGKFDLDHLREIHRRIFSDVYDWAGEIRTVNISRGNVFCQFNYIPEQAGILFEKLKKENYLKGLDKDKAAERLAYYLGEINAIHPFREGNGRAQRAFIRQLAREAGWIIRFDCTTDEMYEASAEAFVGKYDKLTALVKRSMEKAERAFRNPSENSI